MRRFLRDALPRGLGALALLFEVDVELLLGVRGNGPSALFGHVEGALANTVAIADRCTCTIPTHQKLLPHFIPPDGQTAPAYLRAAQHAPALNNFGSAVSIVQDELAHAHIGYRLLGDVGVDMPKLIYEREPEAFKYPYAFDVPLDSWHELVLANALYDQAGFVLLSDVHRSSTFGPWKRALAKVDKEETFHLRHGRTWLKKLVKDPDGKAAVQAAIDALRGKFGDAAITKGRGLAPVVRPSRAEPRLGPVRRPR